MHRINVFLSLSFYKNTWFVVQVGSMWVGAGAGFGNAIMRAAGRGLKPNIWRCDVLGNLQHIYLAFIIKFVFSSARKLKAAL